MTEIIRTAEELLALPVGTVVAWGERQQIGHIAPMTDDASPLVLWVHDGVWFDWKTAAEHLAPLTVLHRPDLPTQADLHATVERVRGLHRRCADVDDCRENDEFCHECGLTYPCPTIRALDTGEGL